MALELYCLDQASLASEIPQCAISEQPPMVTRNSLLTITASRYFVQWGLSFDSIYFTLSIVVEENPRGGR